MKIVTNKELWLLHWCTKFHIDISRHLWVIGVWIVENRTHTHTHTYIRTPAKNDISHVLDYSEYSDTNISNFFLRKQSFLRDEAKEIEFWQNLGRGTEAIEKIDAN